ncbi:nucleotide sugar dehydrogenase [Haladaptatus caseinilyticus]|uniref:nucleotide sugar dehydrogenase n=1 Tax=Haladaptatus caseinilyticus TaxID=2993314 RepID=UPI00224AA9A0|nr:nucleotide sugar dehydrogenase [Haladaptatus caseinilyticus]
MTSNSTDQSTTRESVETVVVVGMGFIGLPLALLLAENGKHVVGVDIDENVVKAINDRTLNFDEAEFESLLASDDVTENLDVRTEPVEGDAFIISVPTPLANPTKSPDLSYVRSALESIIPHLTDGDLINIESTLPPQTCEEMVVPRLEQAGFEPGDDVSLAHSPERILPGNVFEEIRTNDRVIGGIDETSIRRATEIYRPFVEGTIYTTDLLSAELCKLIENTFRDVNIALANEFALIGERLGTNMNEVIELANNHPRVDVLTPGIGVGGHCLPVDPWFLDEINPEYSNLITSARRINDKMPTVAARKVRRSLAEYVDPKIVALGAAYKPGTYDCRNSSAIQIVDSLRSDGYRVNHYDRHVEGMTYETLESVLAEHRPDVVLQLVPHPKSVDELDVLEPWFVENDVKLLQFGGTDPLDPESRIQL